VYAACDDIQMYLIGIILINKDFYVAIYSSYVTCFGRQVLSMLKYYYLLYLYYCIKFNYYYFVRVFPSSGTFDAGAIDPCTSTMSPKLFASQTWENFTELYYNFAKGTAIFQ
jgi:hypothetical protein